MLLLFLCNNSGKKEDENLKITYSKTKIYTILHAKIRIKQMFDKMLAFFKKVLYAFIVSQEREEI